MRSRYETLLADACKDSVPERVTCGAGEIRTAGPTAEETASFEAPQDRPPAPSPPKINRHDPQRDQEFQSVHLSGELVDAAISARDLNAKKREAGDHHDQ